MCAPEPRAFSVRPESAGVVVSAGDRSGHVAPCWAPLGSAWGSGLRSWQFLHWVISLFPRQYCPGPHSLSLASSRSSARTVFHTEKACEIPLLLGSISCLVKVRWQVLAARRHAHVVLSAVTQRPPPPSALFNLSVFGCLCLPRHCRSVGGYRSPESGYGSPGSVSSASVPRWECHCDGYCARCCKEQRITPST